MGHGLPIAAGMAFAKKINRENGNIYVMISDGECQEGTTWETLLISSKLKLDNLIILVDYNKIQALTTLKDGLPLKNLYEKFKSFNCNVVNIKNGHSFKDIKKGFSKIKKDKKTNVLIFNTIKGKGIKKFENDPTWHAKKIREKEEFIGKKSLGIK